MASLITKYTVKLVKEETHRYEIDRHLDQPKEVIKFLREVVQIQENAEEVVVLIALDGKNKTIGFFEVSRGSLNTASMNSREVFKRAMLCNAKSIILAHNHPSGDPTPSKEDIAMTVRMFEAGNLLDITLLDHIIIGETDNVSLKTKGII